MTDTSTRVDKPVDLAKWFIGISVVVFLVFGWFSMGQPGTPLVDGDYGCWQDESHLGLPGPGVTVQGGEVVDVWNFDMRDGSKTSLHWSDPKRLSRKKLTLTSEVPDPNGRGALGSRTATYVCTDEV